ncbi:MAG: hypothetical protein RJB03_1816, partial [Bacteroidota bacterium]
MKSKTTNRYLLFFACYFTLNFVMSFITGNVHAQMQAHSHND